MRCVASSGTAWFEDSVYGTEAAVTAGMTAYGFADGLSPAELAAAGAIFFNELTEREGCPTTPRPTSRSP